MGFFMRLAEQIITQNLPERVVKASTNRQLKEMNRLLKKQEKERKKSGYKSKDEDR
jgi:hypothetical protein